MGDLRNIRRKIDAIDDSILRLLAKRRAASLLALRIKARRGALPRDARREKKLMMRVGKSAKALKLDPRVVADIFRAILKDSVSFQRRNLSAARPRDQAR